MSVLSEYKDSLLFEYQNEFWNERGRGARYRLMLVGTDYLAGKLKDPSDVDEIVEFYKKEGFCGAIEMTEDVYSIRLVVSDCAFLPTRDKFMDQDLQPLSCPIVNGLMRAIELKTGLAPELLPIAREGNRCMVGLGKMGTADVVVEVN